MLRICDQCGRAFESTKPSARYCSGACRQRAYRLRKGAVGFASGDLPPISIPKVTEEQRSRIERSAVASAHMAAGDLSRASRVSPAPRCTVYRELAIMIETSLRGIE